MAKLQSLLYSDIMSVGMLFVPMESTVITKMLPAMHQSVQLSIREIKNPQDGTFHISSFIIHVYSK